MINFTRMILNKGGVSHDLHKEQIPLLVVWNITRKCNLQCKHCYISADQSCAERELSTAEAKKVIDALVRVNTGVMLFSGGEPLMREDIWELADYAAKKGLRCGLSTNGTLITETMAEKIKDSGIIYAGISIDGTRDTHDRFRGARSFDRALAGLRNCKKAGLPVGIRFTVNKYNYGDLSQVIDLVAQEKIPRFCLYHLVYSGRATADMDIDPATARKVVDLMIKKTRELADQDLEILSVDNPCDGIYLYRQISAEQPRREEELRKELLLHHGKCSAGERILDISPEGEVYACQFWNNQSLGNVREGDLSEIWNNPECQLLCGLRDRFSLLKGKCGECSYKLLCGGCRLRALVKHGDLWQEDPACYLNEDEVNDEGFARRLEGSFASGRKER